MIADLSEFSEDADQLPEGRAGLIALLEARGLNDSTFRTAAGAWLDRIPEDEENGRHATVRRDLASTNVLEEAGYLSEALEALNLLLDELFGLQEHMPILYEALYGTVQEKYLSLNLRIRELEQNPLN